MKKNNTPHTDTKEIIPLKAKPEDTFEHWIEKASKGENIAICWQNCYRIAEKLLSQATTKERQATPRLKRLRNIQKNSVNKQEKIQERLNMILLMMRY